MLLAADVVDLQAHTPKEEKAAVISSRNFFRGLGHSCGLAVSANVLQSGLMRVLPEAYASIANTAYSIPHNVDQGTLAAIILAFVHASHSISVANVTIIVTCLVGRAFVGDIPGLASRHKV